MAAIRLAQNWTSLNQALQPNLSCSSFESFPLQETLCNFWPVPKGCGRSKVTFCVDFTGAIILDQVTGHPVMPTRSLDWKTISNWPFLPHVIRTLQFSVAFSAQNVLVCLQISDKSGANHSRDLTPSHSWCSYLLLWCLHYYLFLWTSSLMPE